MIATSFRSVVCVTRRVLPGLLLALTVLQWPAGSPTLAQADGTAGPQTWDKRVQIVVKSVYISDDHDLGEGEMRLDLSFYRTAPGCRPGAFSPGCAISLAKVKGIKFSANDEDTVTVNRGMPEVGPNTSSADPTISPDYGIPVWDGQTYTLSLYLAEEDAVSDDELGSSILVLSRDHGWSLGTNEMRGLKHGMTEPGSFVAEVEIRDAFLPDLRPVDIKVRDLPSSSQKLACIAVQNAGAMDIGAFEMSLQVDGETVPNGRVAAGSLSSGEAKDVCIQAALPTSGEHTLTAFADERGLMVEVSETNNRFEKLYAAGPPALTALPDLVATAIEVDGQVPDGKADCKDGKNAVAVVVKNAGTADAERFAVWLVIDNVEGSLVERSVSGLEVGREREVRFDDVRLKKGQHTLTVSLDPKGSLAESDEDNNGRTVTVSCQSAS